MAKAMGYPSRNNMRLKKPDFKSGIGEALGVAATMPLLVFFILLVITIHQVTTCENQLIYAAYSGGRAAAISFDLETAKENLTEKVESLYPDAEMTATISIGGSEWKKGNVAQITVSQELSPILPIWKGIHSRRLGVMIEHSYWINLYD